MYWAATANWPFLLAPGDIVRPSVWILLKQLPLCICRGEQQMHPKHFGRNNENWAFTSKWILTFWSQSKEEGWGKREKLLTPWGWQELSSSPGWRWEISMSSGFLEEAGGLRAALRAVSPGMWQFVLCNNRGCPSPGHVLQLHQSNAPVKPLGFIVGTRGPEIREKRCLAFWYLQLTGLQASFYHIRLF